VIYNENTAGFFSVRIGFENKYYVQLIF